MGQARPTEIVLPEEPLELCGGSCRLRGPADSHGSVLRPSHASLTPTVIRSRCTYCPSRQSDRAFHSERTDTAQIPGAYPSLPIVSSQVLSDRRRSAPSATTAPGPGSCTTACRPVGSNSWASGRVARRSSTLAPPTCFPSRSPYCPRFLCPLGSNPTSSAR